MERHFILPATIAAALHAGLLFGIRSGHHDATGTTDKIREFVKVLTPFEVPPEPPEETTENNASSPASGVSTERSVSLKETVSAPTPDEFVFTKPRAEPGTSIDPGKISVGPPGLPDGIGPSGPTILSFKDLDGVPRTRLQSAPVYPPEARHNGLTGEVVVEFTVDESGHVSDARAVRSSDRIFEDSAVRAVARWKFEPGLRDGRTVRFRMAVPIVFKLDEN